MKCKSVQSVTVKLPDSHFKPVQQTLLVHGCAHHRRINVATPFIAI